MSLLKSIKQSLSCAHDIKSFFFHLGYSRVELPPSLRRSFARSAWHRSWISGFYGGGLLSILERQGLSETDIFEENARLYYEAYDMGYRSSLGSNEELMPEGREEWFINAWNHGAADAGREG